MGQVAMPIDFKDSLARERVSSATLLLLATLAPHLTTLHVRWDHRLPTCGCASPYTFVQNVSRKCINFYLTKKRPKLVFCY